MFWEVYFLKILAILDDKNQSTFYLYSQKENSLKRMAPSLKIENDKIGSLFFNMELSEFLKEISKKFGKIKD